MANGSGPRNIQVYQQRQREVSVDEQLDRSFNQSFERVPSIEELHTMKQQISMDSGSDARSHQIRNIVGNPNKVSASEFQQHHQQYEPSEDVAEVTVHKRGSSGSG